MLKLLRANLWWNAVVPQVLGWVYFSMLYVADNTLRRFQGCSPPLETDAAIYLLFFVSLIGISSFGYLFNDWCDKEADKAAGKTNLLAAYKPWIAVVIVIAPLLLGTLSWIVMQSEMGHDRFHHSNILFTCQLLLLVVYSQPPVRLKDRAALGVIADAVYGHLNPVFVTLAVFFPFSTGNKWAIVFFTILFAVCSIKGLRNILLHQLHDRKSDAKARTNTAVLNYGALKTIGFINRILIPSEAVALTMLVLVISYKFPPFVISYLLFLFMNYLKFSGWKIHDLPARQLKFKFLHFLNDYYESWMPVFFLIILTSLQIEFLFLLILHLIVFPDFVLKLWRDLKTINENFKTEEDY